jgi:Tfp pilus assembly protein FimT
MWMASVKSGGRIFAIATPPKSKKPKVVGAISFAKSTAVTTNMGTMQINREFLSGDWSRWLGSGKRSSGPSTDSNATKKNGSNV